jgi:hypothetical protein
MFYFALNELLVTVERPRAQFLQLSRATPLDAPLQSGTEAALSVHNRVYWVALQNGVLLAQSIVDGRTCHRLQLKQPLVALRVGELNSVAALQSNYQQTIERQNQWVMALMIIGGILTLVAAVYFAYRKLRGQQYAKMGEKNK